VLSLLAPARKCCCCWLPPGTVTAAAAIDSAVISFDDDREAFNTYSVEFLQSAGAPAAQAASLSMLFGLGGVPSTILAGVLFDRLKPMHRGYLFAGSCIPAVIPLTLLAWWGPHMSVSAAACAITATGFLVSAPYTLTSTVQLAMTSPELVGTTAGLLDAFGYLGAAAIMLLSAFELGFRTLFGVMAALAVLATGVGLLLRSRSYSGRWRHRPCVADLGPG